MARSEVTDVILVRPPNGIAYVPATATVTVYAQGTTTRQNWYTVPSGGSGSTADITVTNGQLTAWLEPGAYDLAIQAGGSTTTQPFYAPADGATGATGNAGVGANWRGVWSSGTTYALGDGVYYLDRPYISNAGSNLNHNPLTAGTAWWGPLYIGALPYQRVDDLSTDPRSVTDWGPLINAAIAGGARRLLFGPYSYPFSTTISITNTDGLVLEGAAGRNWNGAPSASRLVWTGTGSTAAIALPAAAGTVFRDLGVYYNSASFTGDLINMVGSGGIRMENCQVSSLAPAVQQARSLLKLDKVVGNYFLNCMFHGAQALVRGYESGSTGEFSNTVTFRDCVWEAFTNYGICNPGWEWLIDNGTFEFDQGSATAVGIGADFVYDFPDSVFTVSGETSFWDRAYITQQSIKQPVGTQWNMKLHSCTFHNSGLSVPDIDLQGTGVVTIEDCNLQGATIDLGDIVGNGSGSRKERITVRGVDGAVFTHTVSHGQVNIESIGKLTTNRLGQVRTIGGYERVMARVVQRPAVTIHSGASGYTLQQNEGLDSVGCIQISTSGTPTAGLILDVTFSTPMCPDHRISGIPTWLAIELTPGSIATLAPDGDAAAGLGLYYQMANVGSDDTVTSTAFSIGVKNAPAAGKNFVISYRVVQL